MLKKVAIITLVLLNIGCDQLSKNAVRNSVDYQAQISLIDNHLTLTNVENTGAMLGFGQDLSPILKLIFLQAIPVLVLLVLLIRIMRKSNLNIWLVIAFAFVIGGGIGNLIDRILHGSVTDFLHLKLGFFQTGIFNMADVSVSSGVLLIIALSLQNQKLSI